MIGTEPRNEHPDLKVSHPASACLEYTSSRGTRIIRCEPIFCSYVMDLKVKAERLQEKMAGMAQPWLRAARWLGLGEKCGPDELVAVIQALRQQIGDLQTTINQRDAEVVALSLKVCAAEASGRHSSLLTAAKIVREVAQERPVEVATALGPILARLGDETARMAKRAAR